MYILAGVNLGDFFKNLTETATKWGSYFVGFIGLCLIIMAVVEIVKAFASHGRGNTNWLMIIGMILVGGFLFAQAASNLSGLLNLADNGNQTLVDIANGGSGGGGGGLNP